MATTTGEALRDTAGEPALVPPGCEQRQENGEAARALCLGFATVGNPRDRAIWSGTPFFMRAALARQGLEIETIGPLRSPLLKASLAYGRLRRLAGLSAHVPHHAWPVARQHADDAARRIRAARPDVVFALAGSAFAWNTPRWVPLVYASDTTFRLVDGYYPRYRGLSAGARRAGERLERETIARADILLYPSEWAAGSAIRDYGADPARVHVIPWGANLAEAPPTEAALRPREPGPCRLLFVGVDWWRKGGDIALAAHLALAARGIASKLVICGCEPPEPVGMEGVTVVPRLDKSDQVENRALAELYARADFLIVPTRADCYGIVFCEAAAHGLPSLAPATGGVPSAIAEGESGFLLPPDAEGDAYAEVMAGLLGDPARLAALRASSRAAYESRFNWDAWAARTVELIGAL